MRVRSLLFGGIEPDTTLTFGLSSLVPCPNELSPLPLGRSKSGFRPATFCQSVVPNVVGLVSRLPSPPANVLPVSGDEHDCVVPVAAKSQPLELSAKLAAGMAMPVPSTTAAARTPHVRPRRNRRFRCGGIVPRLFKSVFLTFALPLLEL